MDSTIMEFDCITKFFLLHLQIKRGRFLSWSSGSKIKKMCNKHVCSFFCIIKKFMKWLKGPKGSTHLTSIYYESQTKPTKVFATDT